jgi:hypothetical protein
LIRDPRLMSGRQPVCALLVSSETAFEGFEPD